VVSSIAGSASDRFSTRSVISFSLRHDRLAAVSARISV
jgi:hypothetical protein